MRDVEDEWASRAPKELIVPHKHVVGALWSLLDVHNEVDILFDFQDWVDDPTSSATLEEYIKARIGCYPGLMDHLTNFVDAFAELRDYVFRGCCSLAPVVEEFGVVCEGIPTWFGVLRTSWHTLVLGIASLVVREVFDVIFEYPLGDFDEFGCLVGGRDWDKHIDRCEHVTSEEILNAILHTRRNTSDMKFVVRGLVKNLKQDFVLDEFDKIRVHLEHEMFRAWKRKYPGRDDTFKTGDNQPAPVSLHAAKGLSPAERRILEAIRTAGHRLTTEEIIGELERQHGAASLGTTKSCLAGLVRRGLLTNRQDVIPKGYDLK